MLLFLLGSKHNSVMQNSSRKEPQALKQKVKLKFYQYKTWLDLVYPKTSEHPPLYTDVYLIALETVLSQVHSDQECVIITCFYEVWHSHIQYAATCICHPLSPVFAGDHVL